MYVAAIIGSARAHTQDALIPEIPSVGRGSQQLLYCGTVGGGSRFMISGCRSPLIAGEHISTFYGDGCGGQHASE